MNNIVGKGVSIPQKSVIEWKEVFLLMRLFLQLPASLVRLDVFLDFNFGMSFVWTIVNVNVLVNSVASFVLAAFHWYGMCVSVLCTSTYILVICIVWVDRWYMPYFIYRLDSPYKWFLSWDNCSCWCLWRCLKGWLAWFEAGAWGVLLCLMEEVVLVLYMVYHI